MNLPKEPSDPLLKEAMEEIKAVLAKHDIGGIVLLQSRTHGEWLNEITPSWSCAKQNGKELRIKALRKDYPSPELHQETVRLTVSMIMGFKDGAERIRSNMEQVAEALSRQMEIEHISRFDK